MKQKIFVTFFFSLLIFFSCSSSSPTVELIEESFDFGTVYVNNSVSHDFILENKTSSIVKILDARIEGTSEFKVTAGGTGSSIQPKSTLNVSVTFEPVDKGFEQAKLFILHSKSDKEFEIMLEATGETEPIFDIDQTSYDFGKLRKPFSKSKDFTVTNIGTAKLTLNSIAITGPNSSEFTITSGASTPVDIDPNNTHTITVKWLSDDPVGVKSAYLNIDHNAQGSPQSVTLVAETLAIPPLVFVTTALKDAGYYHPYDEDIVVSGGTGNNTFSIITGSLPVGLSLDTQTGKISGKPLKVEKCDFEVEVDDGFSSISNQFSIEVKITTGWIDVTPNGVTLSAKMCIASYKNKLYYFSGSSYSNDIRIFDPAANTWITSKTKLAYTHDNGNAVVYDKYIYVIMGSKQNTVERYDPATDTIATDTSSLVTWTNFAVGVYNKEIYCISGYDSASSGPFDEVYKFTPGPNGTNGTWKQMPNVKTGGFGSAMTVYNNQIVVFGGWELSTNNIAEVRSYDPATGSEKILGKMYKESSRFAWGRIGDELYIGIGGEKTFHKYDLATNKASKLADSPVATTYYTSQYTECDGRIYVSDQKSKIYAYIP